MGSTPNFNKPSTWTCTDEQLASYGVMYLMPCNIALAIYLNFLQEVKVSYLQTHTQIAWLSPMF